MEQRFTKYIHESFRTLTDTYGLRIKTELSEGQSYLLEYSSKNFTIRIEKYFREFYVSLYKSNKKHEDGINLFNLLEYLRPEGAPQSEYFHSENDIDQCYRKQFNYISFVIHENYVLINDFFENADYDLKAAEFEKYWRNKHPLFYKTL